MSFETELQDLINKHSIENGSGTPDFILAGYIRGCLTAFELATNQRDCWYGFKSPSNAPIASLIKFDTEKGITECSVKDYLIESNYTGHPQEKES